MTSKKVAILLWTLFCLFCFHLYGQEERELIDENLAEALAGRLPQDFDYTDMAERLEYYERHPLDVNAVSAEDLRALGFLSSLQISNFLSYRNSIGPFLQIEELQAVDGLDPAVIERLKRYLVIKGEHPKALGGGRNLKPEHLVSFAFSRVIEGQRGYHPDSLSAARYAGNQFHSILRYKLHVSDKVAAALLLEKDPGELLFSKQSGGFDFFSGGIQVKDIGRLKRLVAGDYSLRIGQGISLWTGFAAGKGSNYEYMVRKHDGLQLYSSANENTFMRGLSATIAFGKVEVTPFVSRKRLDARFEVDSLRDISGFTSLSFSGLHRTSAELKNRHVLKENLYGVNIEWNMMASRIGAVVYNEVFGSSLLPSSELYALSRPGGGSLSNVGLYYSTSWKNTYFFGELSHSLHHGTAAVNGLISALSKQISIICMHRLYQKDYYSFYSQSLREAGQGNAETGFLAGLAISSGSKMSFSVYSDVFTFPWLRYDADAPSDGHELLGLFSCNLSRSAVFTLRYRLKAMGGNDEEQGELHYLEDARKQNVRIGLEFKAGHFLFRNRAEVVLYKKGFVQEKGSLLYQDVIFKPARNQFSLGFRIALFDCDSFSSAIYAMENSFTNLYSFPAYYNKGVRFYLNAMWKVSKSVQVSSRYAVSSYVNQDVIGSGLDAIEGNKRSELSVQLKLHL